MKTMKASELVSYLNTTNDSIRIGLWLLPNSMIGQEQHEASRLGIEAIDIRSKYVNTLVEDTIYVGITTETTLNAIDGVLSSKGGTKTILLYNLDLLISKLEKDQRDIIWMACERILKHRRRAALIAFPISAKDLLPNQKKLDDWRQAGRLAEVA
jgi:hypothetical protein